MELQGPNKQNGELFLNDPKRWILMHCYMDNLERIQTIFASSCCPRHYFLKVLAIHVKLLSRKRRGLRYILDQMANHNIERYDQEPAQHVSDPQLAQEHDTAPEAIDEVNTSPDIY